MKIGDLLLLKGFINKKQLQKALRKQAENAINYDKPTPLGKVLIEEGYVTPDDVAEALTDQSTEIKEEKKEMPTQIGESSKFTMDLKFVATIIMIIVSGCAIYFGIQSSISDLQSKDSPTRLEYDYLKGEVSGIKAAGNLYIITYKLDSYDETFKELKSLSRILSPLASDLTYIKEELEKLKNKKIPEVDLSNIERKIDELTSKIDSFEERLKKVESKSGGRF